MVLFGPSSMLWQAIYHSFISHFYGIEVVCLNAHAALYITLKLHPAMLSFFISLCLLNTRCTFSIQRLIRSSRSKSIRTKYNQAYMAKPSDSSHHGVVDNSSNGSQARREEAGKLGPSWYFSRREIEENSPSRRDGIDLKKESSIRKLYCKFLQELGMALKM
jgi:hypothetical protein